MVSPNVILAPRLLVTFSMSNMNIIIGTKLYAFNALQISNKIDLLVMERNKSKEQSK